jgi:3-hydroxymyristoyl/3-hydroxydecanoyl-(acyl carrier protein) dehydratase
MTSSASSASFTVPAEHPSLPGHFPGDPIVPGVVLLDRVVALVGAAVAPATLVAVTAVKFLSPVRPGEAVDLSWRDRADGDVAFECRCGDRAALNGSLRFALGSVGAA